MDFKVTLLSLVLSLVVPIPGAVFRGSAPGGKTPCRGSRGSQGSTILCPRAASGAMRKKVQERPTVERRSVPSFGSYLTQKTNLWMHDARGDGWIQAVHNTAVPQRDSLFTIPHVQHAGPRQMTMPHSMGA